MLGFKLREIFNNYWTIFDIISLFKAYYSQCLLFCAVCKTFKTQFFVGPYLNSFRRLLFTAWTPTPTLSTSILDSQPWPDSKGRSFTAFAHSVSRPGSSRQPLLAPIQTRSRPSRPDSPNRFCLGKRSGLTTIVDRMRISYHKDYTNTQLLTDDSI